MNTKASKKGKANIKRHFIGLGIAFVILLCTGMLGSITGVFDGFADVIKMTHITKEILIQLFVAVSFIVIVNSILQLILSVFRKKSGRIGTLSTVIASLIKYASVLIGFCWGMTIIGVNVSTVFASVGIVALILGFGAESLVADVVTGVFILFENQYNIGDIIEVGGFRGTVKEIGIRSTCIMDTGGNVLIINNSELKNIVNRSSQGSISVCEVGVSYNTDLKELKKKINKIIETIKAEHEDLFIGKLEYLGVEELADSCVKLKFIAEVKEADIFKGRRVLNEEIKCAFDEANIEIAYPQIDVHNK